MIHLACSIPNEIVVAVSGGPDSMALLDFCVAGRKDVTALYVHHGTHHASEAREVVGEYCVPRGIRMLTRYVSPLVETTEEGWRGERLRIYREFTSQGKRVATAHHVDDAVEWWLMSALHGSPKLMKPVDEEHGLLKPFLTTPKAELVDWCKRKGVVFIEDPTNKGSSNTRAVLRTSVMPHLLQIHPGLRSTIAGKIRETF